jgi:malate dehydrogenase
MAEAIIKDNGRVLPAAAMVEGEYGLEDMFIGVPVRLGAGGIDEVIEVDLNDEEQALMQTSADHVQANLDNLKRLQDAGQIG